MTAIHQLEVAEREHQVAHPTATGTAFSVQRTAEKETACTAPDKTTACTTQANDTSGDQGVDSLGAYGCTFVLAPAWSLRLGAEDNVLMSTFVRNDVSSRMDLTETRPSHSRLS